MNRNIKEIISQMTLEEKASLCSGLDFWHTKGIERLGIPSLMMTDGPMPLLTAKNGILSGQAKDDLPLAMSMMQFIPLRALVSLGKGVFTELMIEEFIDKLNETQK